MKQTVDSNADSTDSSVTIHIKGLGNNVIQVVEKLNQMMKEQPLPEATYMRIPDYISFRPTYWEAQVANCEKKSVAKGSEEWTQVEKQVLETLQVNIISIERIQNKWLWEQYCTESRRLSLKNKGDVNELKLFHGMFRKG
jgi:hypothetical protein